MTITGSQPAYLQARAGIERAGASRTGFYSYGVYLELVRWEPAISVPGLVVDRAGEYTTYDLSRYIAFGSLTIHEALNDEIDTASFTLIPSIPLAPKAGEFVRLGLGGNRVAYAPRPVGTELIAGYCLHVRTRWHPGIATCWYDVQCVDRLFDFDAEFVTNEYTSAKGYDIIRDVIERVVSGGTQGYSMAGVDPNLPVIATLPVTNQRPSTVLRAVTSAAGGGFFIAPDRMVHAWGIAGDIRYATPPRPLTYDLKTLKQFAMTDDASQVRTAVLVEGQRASTQPAVPPTPDPANPLVGYESMPLTDGTMFGKTPIAGDWRARVGTQIIAYEAAYGRLDPTLNQPGTTVRVAAAAGDAFLQIVSDAFLASTSVQTRGWVEVGNQYIAYYGWDGGATPRLYLHTSGYGAIQAPIAVGATVTALPFLYDVDMADYFSQGAPLHAQPPGQAVVTVSVRQDVAAQDAWKKTTGGVGTGVRVNLIQDGRLSQAGAEQRGDLDLAQFARPRQSIEWETEDLNAEVGRPQVVALFGLSMTLTITDVELTFPVANRPPRRRCRAEDTKHAGLLDILLTDPR